MTFEVAFTADVCLIKMTPGQEPEVLLVKRGMHTDLEPGAWALPGGHIDPEDGSDTGWAAARELREETGVDAHQTPYQIHLHYRGMRQKPTWVGHVFWGVAGPHHDTEIRPQLGEIQDVAWVPLSKLGTYQIAFDHPDVIKDITFVVCEQEYDRVI